MMVASQWIMAGVVFVLVCLVFAHLQGRKVGRREQEERYNELERPEWEAGIARLGKKCEDLTEGLIAQSRNRDVAFKEAEEGAQATLDAQETKYKRLLDDAAKELSDADRRVDFFWGYPCKLSLSAENGPQIRMRSERQDRAEFDAALTKILAAEEAARDE